MPTPGSPTIVTIRQARSETTRSSSASSASSSAARPTSGESIRRATPAASGSTSSSRHASTGSDFPFSVERGHRLDRDGVADEADRRVADEDLAGGRGRLEPLRDDDGVAGGERIALRRVAGEDLARVDAGAHADP